MPSRSTVNEFSISSPVRKTRIRRVRVFSTPTLPFAFVTNQMRPWKSGRADEMRSSPTTASVRS